MSPRRSQLLGNILLTLSAASSGCAATTYVHHLGRYYSSPVAERAVVLRDGRAVVDFFDLRDPVGDTGPREVYVRRVYLSSAQVNAGSLPAGQAQHDTPAAVAARVFSLARAASTGDESGAWLPIAASGGAPGEYPPIPEQAAASVCASFSRRLGHFEAMSYGVAFLDAMQRACPPENFPACLPRFFVCDEGRGEETALTYPENPVTIERRHWWYLPTRLLFVPAIALDIATFPYQAYVAYDDLRELGRDR